MGIIVKKPDRRKNKESQNGGTQSQEGEWNMNSKGGSSVGRKNIEIISFLLQWLAPNMRFESQTYRTNYSAFPIIGRN